VITRRCWPHRPGNLSEAIAAESFCATVTNVRGGVAVLRPDRPSAQAAVPEGKAARVLGCEPEEVKVDVEVTARVDFGAEGLDLGRT
jgi:hypothetical protein